jgi:hypothetical protein
MASSDLYAKHYSSKRRPIESTDAYHVIIFPSDNSFSVVKSKQCSPAEQDGFIMVQSGGRKYMGFTLETGKKRLYGRDREHTTCFYGLGTLEKCSKVAETLAKKQHEDIESDFERVGEKSQLHDVAPNRPGM